MNKYYLRNRRKQLGLTLKDIALLVGVSESTVSTVEHKYSSMPLS